MASFVQFRLPVETVLMWNIVGVTQGRHVDVTVACGLRTVKYRRLQVLLRWLTTSHFSLPVLRSMASSSLTTILPTMFT